MLFRSVSSPGCFNGNDDDDDEDNVDSTVIVIMMIIEIVKMPGYPK